MNLASNLSCPALISSLNIGCNIEDGQFCKASPCFPASTQATLEAVLQLANSKIHTHLLAANPTLASLGCFCCCTMPGTCITRDMRVARVNNKFTSNPPSDEIRPAVPGMKPAWHCCPQTHGCQRLTSFRDPSERTNGQAHLQ